MTVREFWRRSTALPRASLITAGAALAVNIGTYFGLAPLGPSIALYSLHLVVMALGGGVFVSIVHHSRALARGGLEQVPVGTPRPLLLATFLALVYAIVALSRFATTFEGGEPVPLLVDDPHYRAYHSGMLAVFSAGWLFAGLACAVASFWFITRSRPRSWPPAA